MLDKILDDVLKRQDGIINAEGIAIVDHSCRMPIDTLPKLDQFRVGDMKPHTQLFQSGIKMHRDPECYAVSPYISELLQKSGMTDEDIVLNLSELASFLQLVDLYNLSFPGKYPVRQSIYGFEYSKKYASIINTLIGNEFPKPPRYVLEVGGQQAMLGSSVTAYIREKYHVSRVMYDNVDAFIAGRMKESSMFPGYTHDPDIHIINADFLNTGRIDRVLSAAHERPLQAHYDLLMSFFVLKSCFDPIGMFNQMWDRTSIGGKIILDSGSLIGLTHESTYARSGLDSLLDIIYTLRTVPSVTNLTDGKYDWIAEDLWKLYKMSSKGLISLDDVLQEKQIIFEMHHGQLHPWFPSYDSLVITKTDAPSPFANRTVAGVRVFSLHGTPDVYGSPLLQLVSAV